MKCVCKDCKYAKPRDKEYCYCVKYGCNMRYGREYCISYEPTEKKVWEPKGGTGWSLVRQQEGGE